MKHVIICFASIPSKRFPEWISAQIHSKTWSLTPCVPALPLSNPWLILPSYRVGPYPIRRPCALGNWKLEKLLVVDDEHLKRCQVDVGPWLPNIGEEILPSYVGINQYKDPLLNNQ